MPTALPIRWVEEFALATDGWIKAFPVGTYQRNGRTLAITPDRIQRMERNFKRGVTGYDPPVNVEHKPEYGRVGVIRDMQAREDGLYVLPDEEALTFLRAKRFGYVSPEVVWSDYENSAGEKADDVVVGLAATNTPFFGKQVALFSAKEDFMMPSMGMMEKNEEMSGMMSLMQMLGSACDQHGEDPTMGQALQTARDAVKRKMTQMVGDYSALPDGREEFSKMGQADLETEVGQLHRLTKMLKKFFSPEQAEAIAEAAEEEADKPPQTDKASAGQGSEVYNVVVNGINKEEFAALEAKLTAQAEQYAAIKAENERLAQAVAAEQYRARVAEMDKYAVQFGALSRPENFSAHLVTWQDKLGAEEFAVLEAILKTANDAVKAGGLFSRVSRGAGVETDEQGQFDAEVARYMADHKADKPAAIAAVAEARPDLYTAVRYGK